jgi:hypothetical protein
MSRACLGKNWRVRGSGTPEVVPRLVLRLRVATPKCSPRRSCTLLELPPSILYVFKWCINKENA